MSRDHQLRPDLRVAYRELALLLRRQPTVDRTWREFWVLFLPVLLPTLIVLIVLDRPLSSTPSLIVLAAGFMWMLILHRVLLRRGVIRRRS